MNSVNRKEIIAEKKRIDEIEKKASERDKKVKTNMKKNLS